MHLRLYSLILLLSLSVCAIAQINNPFAPRNQPQEWSEAATIFERLQGLPDTNLEKAPLLAIYRALQSTLRSIGGYTDAISHRESDWAARRRAHVAAGNEFNKEEARMVADGEAYNKDYKAYVAAGGGQKLPDNDPRLPMLREWFNKLLAWHGRLAEWKKRVL